MTDAMSQQRGSWKIRLVMLLAGVLASCGGDDICLQCPSGTPTPGQSGAIVTGTIVSSNPTTAPSAITAIVCVGLEQGQSVTNCPNSFYADVNTDGTFTRKNVIAGAETIFFWVDSDMNGMIDPDDLLAQLTDSQGDLDRVGNGQTVTLANVRIAFLQNSATAEITVGATPTPVPTAVTATPTPANT